MTKIFKLTEQEIKALQSMNDLSQIHEYGIRNMNMVRLTPTPSYTQGDSQITFALDAPKLAGNTPINRVQMKTVFEVTATGVAGEGSGFEGTAPYQVSELSADGYQNYLFSVSNSALDSLVTNKAFSSIQIAFGSVNMQKETRTPERLDVLSRLLDQDNCREAGLELDSNQGRYIDKGAGPFELVELVNPDIGLVYSYAKGCDYKHVMNNIFFKRNMNSRYINRVKYASGDVGYAEFSINGGAFVKSDPTSVSAPERVKNNSKRNANLNTFDYLYDWTAAPSAGDDLIQRQLFEVKEDLLYDIFTTKYQSNPDYRGLPSPQIHFTFNISPNINALFKTSNDAITNITVSIRSMELNILTYNHGALDIIPKPYSIPFYTEQEAKQDVIIETNAVSVDNQFTTIQYNQMPHYILFYCSEPTTSGVSQNKQQNLNATEITSVELTINNDQGSALYKLNKDELRYRTLTNLNDHEDNVHALFTNWRNDCDNLPEIVSANAASPPSAVNLNAIANYNTEYPDKPYLDGVYLLKIGKDIRISPQLMSGLNVPTNFTFKVSFGNQYNRFSAGNICQFTTVAFFPAFYQISPTEGLLRIQNITVSEEEMLRMIDATNQDISSGQMSNKVEYTHKYPLMVGSGWFGSLLKAVPKAIGLAPRVAECVSTVKDVGQAVKSALGRGRR